MANKSNANKFLEQTKAVFESLLQLVSSYMEDNNEEIAKPHTLDTTSIVSKVMCRKPAKFNMTFDQALIKWHDTKLRVGKTYSMAQFRKAFKTYKYVYHDKHFKEVLETERIPGTAKFVKKANWYYA